MTDTPKIANPFNLLVTSGELLQGVMSDERRHELLNAAKSFTSEGNADAMSALLLAVQGLQHELAQTKEALAQLEVFDKMTGLHNKNYIFNRIEEAIVHARREHSSGGILLDRAIISIDLDGLKPINDYISPNAGDAAIKAVGERLKKVVRSDDDVAHISGDEFIAVVTNRSKQQPFLEKVLERYRHELRGIAFEYNDHYYPVEVSIGGGLITEKMFAPEDYILPGQILTPTAKNILDEANRELKAIKAAKGISRHAAAPAPITPPLQLPSIDP